MLIRRKVNALKRLLLITMLLTGHSLEAIDVQVENRPLQEFLPWLAFETGNNVVISPEVTGELTMVMRGTSWRELLEAIATQHKLSLIWQGESALLANKEVQKTVQSMTEAPSQDCQPHFWLLEHAKAATVGEHLKTLYPKVLISVDERTNAVIYKNCQNHFPIERLVEQLDRPLRQIEISARIAQVRSNAQSQIGVEWEAVSGSPQVASGLGGAVDLGAIEFSSALSIGMASGEKLLSLTLDLLESEGSANIVSEPKIVTAEGQPAKIESGTEVPYQSQDENGSKIEFKQAGLMLEVTPFVIDGDKIQLKLTIHQDAVGDLVNGIPSLETNRVQTQVVVIDQETLVLGGIYRDETLVSESKVPLLGDLPILGVLFKRRIERQEKVELLV